MCNFFFHAKHQLWRQQFMAGNLSWQLQVLHIIPRYWFPLIFPSINYYSIVPYSTIKIIVIALKTSNRSLLRRIYDVRNGGVVTIVWFIWRTKVSNAHFSVVIFTLANAFFSIAYALTLVRRYAKVIKSIVFANFSVPNKRPSLYAILCANEC